MTFNLKKIFALRSQLIKAVTVILIILVIINVLVYNALAEMASIRGLRESTGIACSQIGISYETTLSYMAEAVIKIAIFDFADYTIVTEAEKMYEFQISMNKELSSIISMNSYISSAYIYIAELDNVFDSRQGFPRISSLEAFQDRGIFGESRSNYLHLVGPRILTTNIQFGGARTVITLISPIFFKNGHNAYLAVNINAENFYNVMLKNVSITDDFTFYVYNADNTVIIHSADKTKLYTALDPEILHGRGTDLFYYFHRDQPIAASYISSYLNWTFVLETPVKPVINDLHSYIIINLLVVFIILGIIISVVFIKTGMVSKAAIAMSEVLWKEALLDRVYIDSEMKQQLSGGDFLIEGRESLYGIISIDIFGGGYTASVMVKPVYEKLKHELAEKNCEFKLIPVSKNNAALVLKYKAGDASLDIHRNIARRLLECLSPDEQRLVFIALSGLQKNIELLPLCYRQCEDAFKYKICLESRVLDYSLIRDLDAEYDFQAELAYQLNNNIAIGNESGCAAYLDKIFIPIEKKHVIVSDEQIINLVMFLQNGAFKTISGLPVPVKVDTGPVVNAERLRNMSLVGIKASLLSFYERICGEINLLKENQERRLFMAVMEHIEKNCLTDHLISLVSVADDLQISKNQVSSIVKEATGLDFPEFINKKRIEYAKELLLNKNMTIEEIAKAAGYNYSYYFIKIFKSLEGVTPGQYRAARIVQGNPGAEIK
jgi:AraC-like DNA-binding protein